MLAEKNPYTYFNHNINSCAISLRGKKMSFCSFVIENHNKIYGSVNCTESHERFIFIHHASSQRTLRTFPEYDSLMPSKGSTMHSATSWANPHLNYCHQTSPDWLHFCCLKLGVVLIRDSNMSPEIQLYPAACKHRFCNQTSTTGLGSVVQTLNDQSACCPTTAVKQSVLPGTHILFSWPSAAMI